MKHLVMATAGHIDHGKTVLVRALTGIDTDRLAEEKQRGISIVLGYAHMELPGGERLGIVDVPGHERFVRTMLAGVGGVDFVMLVIAADDGVMPQTREHLDIIHLLGIRRGLVALTKIDLADAETVELAAEEIRDLLAPTALADAEIIPVSAVTGEGVDRLRSSIQSVAGACPQRSTDQLVRLPLDRVFSAEGFGTVGTGTLFSGRISVGDRLVCEPVGIELRVRGLQAYKQDRQDVSAGQRTAVNLAGDGRERVEAGHVLCTPGAFLPTSMLDVAVWSAASSPRPLRHGMPIRAYLGTGQVRGRLALLGDRAISAGGSGHAQLRLDTPLVARRGDRMVLRDIAGEFTVAGCEVIDVHPNKHRRHRSDVAAALASLHEPDLGDVVVYELAKIARPCTTAELARRLGEADRALAEAVQKMSDENVVEAAETESQAIVWHRDVDERLGAALLGALKERHATKPLLAGGLSPSALAVRLGQIFTWLGETAGPVVHRLCERMVGAGELKTIGPTVALASHEPKWTDDQQAIRRALLAGYGEDPFSPQQPDALTASGRYKPADVEAVNETLLDEGLIARVAELYFVHDAVEQARQKVEAYFETHETMLMADFRDLIGSSRKFAVPLMNHFDDQQLFDRDGDVRRLRRK